MKVLGNALITGTSLLSMIKKHENSLTDEQIAERDLKRESEQQLRVTKARILQNICPSCEGKLIRGKKDKRNDYKRSWECSSCTDIYTLDGKKYNHNNRRN